MDLIILFFFLGGKKTSCDYGFDSRTLKNIRAKKLNYSESSQQALTSFKIDTTVVNSFLKKGDVDFSEIERNITRLAAENSKLQDDIAKSKDEFNEEIDFLGARMSFGADGGFASSLSKYSDIFLSGVMSFRLSFTNMNIVSVGLTFCVFFERSYFRDDIFIVGYFVIHYTFPGFFL